jgi:hypothetical protein
MHERGYELTTVEEFGKLTTREQQNDFLARESLSIEDLQIIGLGNGLEDCQQEYISFLIKEKWQLIHSLPHSEKEEEDSNPPLFGIRNNLNDHEEEDQPVVSAAPPVEEKNEVHGEEEDQPFVVKAPQTLLTEARKEAIRAMGKDELLRLIIISSLLSREEEAFVYETLEQKVSVLEMGGSSLPNPSGFVEQPQTEEEDESDPPLFGIRNNLNDHEEEDQPVVSAAPPVVVKAEEPVKERSLLDQFADLYYARCDVKPFLETAPLTIPQLKTILICYGRRPSDLLPSERDIIRQKIRDLKPPIVYSERMKPKHLLRLYADLKSPEAQLTFLMDTPFPLYQLHALRDSVVFVNIYKQVVDFLILLKDRDIVPTVHTREFITLFADRDINYQFDRTRQLDYVTTTYLPIEDIDQLLMFPNLDSDVKAILEEKRRAIVDPVPIEIEHYIAGVAVSDFLRYNTNAQRDFLLEHDATYAELDYMYNSVELAPWIKELIGVKIDVASLGRKMSEKVKDFLRRPDSESQLELLTDQTLTFDELEQLEMCKNIVPRYIIDVIDTRIKALQALESTKKF